MDSVGCSEQRTVGGLGGACAVRGRSWGLVGHVVAPGGGQPYGQNV